MSKTLVLSLVGKDCNRSQVEDQTTSLMHGDSSDKWMLFQPDESDTNTKCLGRKLLLILALTLWTAILFTYFVFAITLPNEHPMDQMKSTSSSKSNGTNSTEPIRWNNFLPFNWTTSEYLEVDVPNYSGPFQFCIDHNVTRVALLADSQGPRWQNALIRYLQKNGTGFISKMIRQEGGSRQVNNTYFEDDHLLTHNRECSGCQSKLWSVSKGGHEVHIEYLSQEFVMDTEIQRFLTQWDRDHFCHERNCQNMTAYSTQEYYWKMYFQRDWPQIVVRFATLMHDGGRFTEFEFTREFRHQLQIILDYTPRTTKVYWMTGQSFANHQWHSKMRRWNDIAVRLINEYGEDRVVIIPLDLFEIKSMLTDRYPGQWHANNAHMTQPFYDHVMTTIWPWIEGHYVTEM